MAQVGIKFKLPVITGETAPTISNIGENNSAFWVDTVNSKVYLCFNYGGIIKKVELTD